MKSLVPAFAIILGWASAAYAAPSGELTTLHAVRSLTDAEARQGLPVAFQATVTYFRGYEDVLFAQDQGEAIFVRPLPDSKLAVGDRILIRGTTQASFRPIVIPASVTLLRHGSLPTPAPAAFEELIRAERDSMLVTVDATVRAADVVLSAKAPVHSAHLQLLTKGGHFEAYLDCDDASKLKNLLDADVQITGVAAGKFDDKMQQTGAVLYVSSLADVKVLKRDSAGPWSLPVTPMDKILSAGYLSNVTRRVHLRGTITYYQPGAAVVLQDGSKSLWIETETRNPLKIGDRAEATGFPDARDRLLTLTDAEIDDLQVSQPVSPQPATWMQLGFWSSSRPDGHMYDLVSTEGEVVAEAREASQDEYVLAADGRLFSAIYRHPYLTGSLSPMTQIPVGSKIRVTGICVIADTRLVTPGQEAPFNILLRSFDDIAVLAPPSLLNVRNLVILLDLLVLVIFAVGTWGWLLERRVRRQTAVLAARTEMEANLERRRSHILEDVNGSKPLAAIIEEITQLVSFRLGGVPCWCEITEGARLGEYPPAMHSLRVLQQKIHARSGPTLGTFFAAFNPETPLAGSEDEVLLVGARLARLAIETRRMNADLVHRSEFDLLTDVRNRFSLSKRIDEQIQKARLNASIFGLIYIDLDGFKQVNDNYGHHVGDLYLQEVARRMKLQLRSHDLLARLGGDEFAALLPMVRNRDDVEEISGRLQHCFHDPLVLEGHTIGGSASCGIALYPTDSVTADGLLHTADTAMYAVKNHKKANAIPSQSHGNPKG